MGDTYNVTVELAIKASAMPDPQTDQLLAEFADYSPVLAASDLGRTDLIISIPADNLLQALSSARALVGSVSPAPRRIVVEPSADFDRRSARAAMGPIPPLMSITEAADALGLTRGGVLKRVESGELPGVRVGGAGWAILAAAVSAIDYGPHRGRSHFPASRGGG